MTRCPRCHFVLENFTRKYIAIGTPFTTCPSCSATVLLNNISEWDMLTFFGKAGYILSFAFTGLMYSMVPVLGLLFIMGEEWMNDRYYVLFLSLLASEIYIFYRLSIEIKESKKRLNNKEYKDKLLSFGLKVY